MSAPKAAYHHGDLPAALVHSALELLDEDSEAELSLRAVARNAGVSASAPYRHYADREALVSAVAATGYQELADRLAGASPAPTTLDELANAAVAYVRFALDRPALFRIMFGESCDRDNDDRVAAVAAVHEYLHAAVERVFASSDPDALATAAWATVHGLAFLHLDGKLESSSEAVVEERIRSAIRAIGQGMLA